jgi:hypothetical protein
MALAQFYQLKNMFAITTIEYDKYIIIQSVLLFYRITSEITEMSVGSGNYDGNSMQVGTTDNW